MPTLFAVYNIKEKQMAEEYDKYLKNTKIPGMRGAPWCTAFSTWKIDKVFAPELRKHLNPQIEVLELDTHLNTPEFARAAVDALDEMMTAR